MQGFETLDFDGFHRRELPARLAGGFGRIAAADLGDTAPLGFRLHERTEGYTYAAIDGTVQVLAGLDTAAAVVVLHHEDWQDLMHELRTVFGLLYAGKLEIERGRFEHVERWWPAMRAMLTGRAIYDEARLELRDRDAAALDLHRSFTLDDDIDDIAHYLRTAGYLHLKSVYSPPEIATLSAEVDRLRDAAIPGDGHSWWANDAAGKPTVCRLTYANDLSDVIAHLHEDVRAQRIAAFSGEELACVPDRMEGHSVILKIPHAVDGLADLPWHVDCGLGGHSLMCPAVLIGVQLDAANEDSGRLHMRAGSFGTSCHMRTLDGEMGRLEVAIDTEPGDCTVHYADVLHAAPPPRVDRPGRRTLYMNFFSPRLFEHVGPGEAYNDVLGRRDDGVAASVDQLLDRQRS